MRGVVAGLIAAASITTLTAADASFIGKWKLDTNRSKLAGDSVTIEKLPDGMMQFSAQGFTYRFKLDGKEYPTPDGGTTAWTAKSADVWEVANRLNGKVTNRFELTLKGDTIGTTVHQTKADGGTQDGTGTYTRVSGGPGFVGKWRSTAVNPPAAVLEIVSNGGTGVTVKDDTGFTCSGTFDEKDNPVAGTMAGAKMTMAFKKLNDRSFQATTKLDGKPFGVDVYSVSADGKTLTDEATPLNAKTETAKLIYHRQ